ncbi:MAG: hypothetical protein ACPG8W_08425 [Candidatus Promineifilaceae bacterium]
MQVSQRLQPVDVMDKSRRALPRWGRVVLYLFLLIGGLLPTLVNAQSEDISALLSTETPSFNVGDRVALDLTVRHPAMYRLIPPELVGVWGDLEVLDVIPVSIEPSEDGFETTRVRLMVTAWEPRTYTTPPVSLEMGSDVGELVSISAESINLNVASILGEQDLNLRDLKPQAGIADLSSLLRNLITGTVLAFAIGIVTLYAFRRNQRLEEAIALTPPVELRPPNMIALQEIDAIEERNLPEAGLFNEHYTGVTDVLRRYVERSFKISAMEATTAEIREALRDETRIDAEHRQQFISMLQSADLVKFARAKPDLKAAKLLPGRARAFVRDSYIEPVVQPQPVEEETP